MLNSAGYFDTDDDKYSRKGIVLPGHTLLCKRGKGPVTSVTAACSLVPRLTRVQYSGVQCASRPKYLVGQMGLGLGPGNALLSLSL